MKNIFVQLLTGLVFCTMLMACDSDEPLVNRSDELSEFCEAFIAEDEEFIGEKVDVLCADLLPQSTDSDALGHEINLNTLIERLNQEDCLVASLGCYGCIETFPLISEIYVQLPSNDKQYVIDLRTPGDGILVFSGMH